MGWRLGWGLVAGVGAVLLPGCAAAPAKVAVVAAPDSSGLELRLLSIEDVRENLARALAEFESQPTPVDARTHRRLRESGLRLVSVPEGDLERVLASLRQRGPSEVMAAREMPQWTKLVSGPEWAGVATLRGSDGLMYLSAGRVQMWARSWIEPGSFDAGRVSARLRVELAGRYVERASERILDRAAQEPSGPLPGEALESLGASFRLEPGVSLVIVPEEVEENWSEAARLANYVEQQPDEDEFTPEKPDPVIGPRVPRPMTLGHALLSDGVRSGRALQKGVLILTARVPAEFRIRR